MTKKIYIILGLLLIWGSEQANAKKVCDGAVSICAWASDDCNAVCPKIFNMCDGVSGKTDTNLKCDISGMGGCSCSMNPAMK